MYPPELVAPMKADLTQVGFKELLTAEDVETALAKQEGTSFLVVNSVCGCAAGAARPAVKEAVKNDKLPNNLLTVFAGVDSEAVQKAREFMAP
ncbi:MAG: BrxA/BrxB family bacilliredoxin, partial [Flavobacteriales bacterium]|nr:BrxA/BrxB family bacilliredoxin [Flavobacteriales bacterium]